MKDRIYRNYVKESGLEWSLTRFNFSALLIVSGRMECGREANGKWFMFPTLLHNLLCPSPGSTHFFYMKKTKTTGAIWKILEIVDSLKPKCVLGVHAPMSMNETFLVLFRERVNQGLTTSARKTVWATAGGWWLWLSADISSPCSLLSTCLD